MYAEIMKEYQVYSCQNNHSLAVKFKDDPKYFIASFSSLIILFPNEVVEQVDFHELDFYKLNNRVNKAISDKIKMKKKMSCVICN